MSIKNKHGRMVTYLVGSYRYSHLNLKWRGRPWPFERQIYKMVKHTQKIRRLLPTNFLSVLDHFVGLALNVLIPWQTKNILYLLLQQLCSSNLVRCWYIMKSSHPIKLFCEVTWHIKHFIYPLALDLSPPNMGKWGLTMISFHR